ncbi:MAG: ABC transporter permease [Candidatus Aceula meridiana]|nr:ABC transporter permease [Candidatus Aceula meridiana]
MLLAELKDIIRCKDLLLIFIWKEFSVRYNQAVFGIAWAIIQPLSFMLVFTFIFTYVIPTHVSNLPRPVFFYSGLLPWTFFLSSLNYSVPSLTNHHNLIKKIKFPRIFLPLSGIAVAFVDFLIAGIIFAGILFFYKIPIPLTALFCVPLTILLILFTVSFSLLLCSINVYYRDVGLAIATLLRLWFFATPILYSLDNLPERFKIITFLNPLAYIIKNLRICLFLGKPINVTEYLSMLIAGTIFLIMSFAFFKIAERKFADVI